VKKKLDIILLNLLYNKLESNGSSLLFVAFNQFFIVFIVNHKNQSTFELINLLL